MKPEIAEGPVDVIFERCGAEVKMYAHTITRYVEDAPKGPFGGLAPNSIEMPAREFLLFRGKVVSGRPEKLIGRYPEILAVTIAGIKMPTELVQIGSEVLDGQTVTTVRAMLIRSLNQPRAKIAAA